MSGLPIDPHLAWVNLPAMGHGLLINIIMTFLTLGIGLFTSLLVTLATRFPSGPKATWEILPEDPGRVVTPGWQSRHR